MKKTLKWITIIVGSLLILAVIVVIWLMIRYDRFGQYPSGGVLSEAQAKYDVLFYDLNLEVDPEDQSLRGFTTVKIRSTAESLKTVELDLINNYEISKVTDSDGHELQFDHGDEIIRIKTHTPLRKNDMIDLSVFYRGRPIEALYSPWIGGFNWSKDTSDAHWVGVACQGEGAKIWFPCKDHPSDEPDSAAINITVPEPYFCASNGLLREVTKPRPGFQTYHWFTTYPINNYNINISIGMYEALVDSYRVEDGSTMPVIYYVLPQGKQRADTLVKMAIEMLSTYRKYFGEYPFTREKFGLVQTDYLGMEHQTINAYGNGYRFRTFEGHRFDVLMLHEMGHEWWGNKLTVSDWADMWIQEGICRYGEALYILEQLNEDAYHKYMREIQGHVRNKKPIIPGRNATTSDVYQGDIYVKGASLMHSLRYIHGDSLFFTRLKHFITDSAYTYQNFVTTEDFVALFDGQPDHDYRPYLDTFLNTTELPQFVIDSVANETYRIYCTNISCNLPVDVTTTGRTERIQIGQSPVEINSPVWPVLDNKGWYLKLVQHERSALQRDG